MADAGCEYCVMEASSIGLKDQRVAGIPFEVGVFTNFSEDHIGGVEHRDMQEYLESKAKLFSMCKTGVVNLDDDNVEGILKGHTCKVKTYGFGQAAQLRGADCRHLTRRASWVSPLKLPESLPLPQRWGFQGVSMPTMPLRPSPAAMFWGSRWRP